MTEAIINYIEFLKSEYMLEISIHGSAIIEHLDFLAPYNSHDYAYCMYVKSSQECWKRCRKSQEKACEKCREGEFFGSCYAGVGEFVFPVSVGGENRAFVSVGGYVGSRLKLCSFAEKYGFGEEKLLELSKESLKKEIPDIKLVKTLISPLCAMLTLLIEKQYGYKGDEAEIFGKILSILHTGYARKLKISDIAEECHYSEAFVCRHFKKMTGLSIGKYLSNLRLEKAMGLLINTGMSIEDIGAACGFFDTNYFISSFSRHYGLPPKKYKKNMMAK